MLFVLAGILGFITIAGLGFAFAGGDSAQAKAAKRAQVIAKGGERQASVRAKAAASTPDARRQAILKALKDQERKQKKASLSIAARLQAAGLGENVKMFWIVSAVLGLFVAMIILLLGQSPLVALGAGFAAGAGLPRWVLGFLANGRTQKFTAAFADAVDIIVRGIKSGLPVHDCLKIIGKECPEPLAGEFRTLTENVAMGVPMDAALEKMYERMPTNELRFFSIVLAIQQKTGGNLAEALGNLSTVLRARKLMKEKIKALSAEAVASAFIIGCLPPGVVTLISVTSPAYMAPMFTDPRGHLMLLVSAVWMSIGIFVMRNMINFKF
ncbi:MULTISPECIES: type II secretion system F family protein [unclassified Caulobacter]|uniref:type II secretion system F family protein n=1 Tax=unclassified Caulobacter TaxID=2648921 RepID=UPI0007807D82|nr:MULTISPECIES: type II secretion system F family protein [unclassified Caulobacter]AZS20369.1 type II secretion system F family protein [Caulobacter sp. FWC26]